MSNKFSSSLSSFLSLSQEFEKKICKRICNFSSQIRLFKFPMVHLLQSNFSFFRFDSILWSLEYSIKVLFKDHTTENHDAFERKLTIIISYVKIIMVEDIVAISGDFFVLRPLLAISNIFSGHFRVRDTESWMYSTFRTLFE